MTQDPPKKELVMADFLEKIIYDPNESYNKLTIFRSLLLLNLFLVIAKTSLQEIQEDKDNAMLKILNILNCLLLGYIHIGLAIIKGIHNRIELLQLEVNFLGTFALAFLQFPHIENKNFKFLYPFLQIAYLFFCLHFFARNQDSKESEILDGLKELVPEGKIFENYILLSAIPTIKNDLLSLETIINNCNEEEITKIFTAIFANHSHDRLQTLLKQGVKKEILDIKVDGDLTLLEQLLKFNQIHESKFIDLKSESYKLLNDYLDNLGKNDQDRKKIFDIFASEVIIKYCLDEKKKSKMQSPDTKNKEKGIILPHVNLDLTPSNSVATPTIQGGPAQLS